MTQQRFMRQTCDHCGQPIYQGFAQCKACGKVRPEFDSYKIVIRESKTACSFSGADTDVCLPNGDGIWAPYFLDFVDAGWLTPDFQYTETFYEKHPDMHRKA
jgi:hypothetical protein